MLEQANNIPVLLQFITRQAEELYTTNPQYYATPLSAGFDLRACMETAELVLQPDERKLIPAGIAIAPQIQGIAGFVYSRSGLGAIQGIVVTQGVGVIDPDYRGEITVSLHNITKAPHTISQGERIAQLVFQPFQQADFSVVSQLSETQRGAGGFGHTGKK